MVHVTDARIRIIPKRFLARRDGVNDKGTPTAISTGGSAVTSKTKAIFDMLNIDIDR